MEKHRAYITRIVAAFAPEGSFAQRIPSILCLVALEALQVVVQRNALLVKSH